MRLGYEPPESSGDAQPAVIFWYRLYAGTLALAYLGCLAFMLFLVFGVTREAVVYDPHATTRQIVDLVVILLSLFLGVFFAIATFVPRRPWGWSVGVCAIGIGLLGGVTLPFSVPLLVFWLKPVTKAAFGRLPI